MKTNKIKNIFPTREPQIAIKLFEWTHWTYNSKNKPASHSASYVEAKSLSLDREQKKRERERETRGKNKNSFFINIYSSLNNFISIDVFAIIRLWSEESSRDEADDFQLEI